jgi:hypothetical protein
MKEGHVAEDETDYYDAQSGLFVLAIVAATET